MRATTPGASSIEFERSFALAVPELVVEWSADQVPGPRVVAFNRGLARQLGLDVLAERPAMLTGSETPAGARPVAMVYAGHQFGHYNPRLGDGRALLVGEIVGPAGRRVDLHLKGSGRTPFARGGDGKAALGPMLREYLVSEAMHALGIPTTRSLAVTTTGEYVHREGDRTGAVLARVAASHLRVGTFEFAARLPDPDVLRRLADHAIERHHPAAAGAEDPYLALLEAVVDAQADLVARWMLIGFVHGVMNTDNTTISGETIDYGPCAFVDHFDPDAVFSSIDHAGRYRYANQPEIARWNLARLAETLLPLMPEGDGSLAACRELIDGFPDRYARRWSVGMAAKLGLAEPRDGDGALFTDLLAGMHAAHLDYTGTFRRLAAGLRDHRVVVDAALADWHTMWTARLDAEGRDAADVADAMDRTNPVYIPRSHLVEAALDAAASGDLEPFHELLAVVTSPFGAAAGMSMYAEPAPPGFTEGYRTFCGT